MDNKQAILGFTEFFKGITGNQNLEIPSEIAEKCGIQADGNIITALCSLPKIISEDGQDYVQLFDVLKTVKRYTAKADDGMREATPEEREAVDKYIKSISKPTGVDFGDAAEGRRGMTREEAIAIIENEKKCVNRANKNDYCNRDCYNCELVKTDIEILTALDMAIKALEQEPCEDAISRQAVLSKKIYTETEEGWSGYTVDADYIEHLPSVRPQEPKWIPVSERLPEENGRYLCTVGTDYRNPREMYYEPKGKNNRTWASLDRAYVEDCFVIAWMPLPKPARLEEDNG